MSEKDFEQTKELIENFNSLDDTAQDKLLNGVKSLAWLYSLVDTKNDVDKDDFSAQPA